MSLNVLIVLAAAAATSAAPAPASKGGACFYASDLTNWVGVGSKQVNVEVRHRDVYRLDLAQDCPQLKFAGQTLALDTRGALGPVCASSLPDVVVPGQGPLRCPVAAITKLTPEEVKALPKKERP